MSERGRVLPGIGRQQADIPLGRSFGAESGQSERRRWVVRGLIQIMGGACTTDETTFTIRLELASQSAVSKAN
jgi:hypothetical protein